VFLLIQLNKELLMLSPSHRFLFVALTSVLFAGCASHNNVPNTVSQDKAIYDEYIPECTFKDGQTPAPKWVCGYPIDAYTVTEIAYSDSGNEGEAKALALVKLAGRIQTEVESETTTESVGENRRSEQRFKQVSRQLINQRLNNTRVLLRMVDPSTQGLHVLVVADDSAYDKAMRQATMN
jgi:hypothetical protein